MRRSLALPAALIVIGLLLATVAAAPAPEAAPPVVISLDATGTSRALALAYSPDGQWLAVGTSTGLVLYDAHTHAEVRFTASATWVRSVAFSPDSQTLAAGYYAPEIQLWRVSDGALLRTLTGHTGWVRSVVFTPDGATLLSASDDQTVRWWRVSDGAPLRTLSDGMTGVRVIAVSPDGATLAAGGADGQVRLLRAADGTLLRTLAGHTAWIRSLAFSPDSQTLASGAFDATARLWQVSDGAPLFELRGHTFSVLGVAFAPDGRTLATGSVDGRIALWRVADGLRLRVLEGHTGFIFAVAYAPDGLTLASAATDNTVRLWPVSANETPQTDNVPVIPSTSCVECHHPRGDYMLPGGETSSPPVLDVACASCHEGGTLVLHWCPAFPQAAGTTAQHGSLATLSNQIGFPHATRTFALALASPGNGEHYYVPATHTVLPVSGQLVGTVTADVDVTLEVWAGGVRTGTAHTRSAADGSFFFSTDLRPNGVTLEVPIEQRACVLCHSETLSASPYLSPGDVRLVVSAVGPHGEAVSDERWITVDQSRQVTAVVTLAPAQAGEQLPALTVQAGTRLYGWRGRQFSGISDAAGVAHLELEALTQVSADYVFSLPPTVMNGRLYASVVPVTVTVAAGAERVPPVTLLITSQAGMLTGQLPTGAGPMAIYAIHLPDGARLDTQTSEGGGFTFTELPLGRYLVMADPTALAALGLTSAAQMIDLTDAPHATVALETLPLGAAVLRGTVLDAQGSPLPFAWVTAGPLDPPSVAEPATARWTLRSATARPRSLVASAPGYYSQALAVPSDPTAPIEFRLRPRPDLRQLAWGAGQVNVPAESLVTVDGLHLTLASGWLWGQGDGATPVVIEANGAVLTVFGGPFAVVSVPGHSAWLYLSGGRAEAYPAGQPAQVTALTANTMLALVPAAGLTAVPLDPLVIQALPATAAPLPAAWQPTLAAQLQNRLGLWGINAAQLVTFVTYVGVLIALFALPIVGLSWWVRSRRKTGRFAHV